MKIPKIGDSQVLQGGSYTFLRLIASLVLGVGIFLLANSLYGTFDFTVVAGPPLVAFIAFVCSGIALEEVRYDRAKSAYRDSLCQLETAHLVRLANSQELTRDERTLVVECLNTNHPGWSLS